MPAATQSGVAPDVKKLGIIAGGGSLPAKLAQACESRGIEIFIVALEGQTDPSLLAGRNHLLTRIGAAGQIIETLKFHEVRDLVLIGSVRRPGLAEMRPDLRAVRFFAQVGLRALGDDGLLKALKSELGREGFRVRGVQEFIENLVAGAGPVGRVKPDNASRTDIVRGFEVLRIMGPADVGQSVIVQENIVLGVEAAEGTDELIGRCIAYKRGGR
ncbi:MAG TPA: UDP-2,3-diacylglucosamine diphosphatase LpxI, partial [Alphaproteobacteria bacterium]